jgi:creatinine amidohydrolase
VREICQQILGYGCRKLLVLDTGISTMAPIDRALAQLSADQALHLKIHQGPRYQNRARELARQSHGSHADELETSIMLALAPDWVEMSRAEASPPLVQEVPGPLTPSQPKSPNYSRSGSYGDPTLATREKGEILLAAMMEDLIDAAEGFIGRSGRDARQPPAIPDIRDQRP